MIDPTGLGQQDGKEEPASKGDDSPQGELGKHKNKNKNIGGITGTPETEIKNNLYYSTEQVPYLDRSGTHDLGWIERPTTKGEKVDISTNHSGGGFDFNNWDKWESNKRDPDPVKPKNKISHDHKEDTNNTGTSSPSNEGDGRDYLVDDSSLYSDAAKFDGKFISDNKYKFVIQKDSGAIEPLPADQLLAVQLFMGLGTLAINGAKGLIESVVVNNMLMSELKKSGIKFTKDAIVKIAKNNAGEIIFLEKGSIKAGLEHIISKHGSEFVNAGIKTSEIPNFLMNAVINGEKIGMQGTRPIYKVLYKNVTRQVAITVGDNGFIVGANIIK